MSKIKIINDIANNHAGSVEKGKEIIRQHSEVIKDYKDTFDFYLKFQYRDLDNGFIHSDYKDDYSFKYIKRFSETKLSNDQFLELKEYAESVGFKTIATPFDEESVSLMVEQGYREIKIASCSSDDFPLIERIAETKLPVILSTAGISFEDLDNVVMFFRNKNIDLSLMHCVAKYPSNLDELELNQITLLKERYPDVTIGYSTHEDPIIADSGGIAVGKGAKILERHIDISCDTINKYSSVPMDIKVWLTVTEDAIKMCGVKDERYTPSDSELESLHGLRRGMFVNRDVKEGEVLKKEDVFFAIPLVADNHLSANDFSKYNEMTVVGGINKNDPVLTADVSIENKREKVLEKVKRIKPLIKESGIALPDDVDLELSHHFGIDRFDEVGAYIIDIINTENYCKKYIIMNPNTFHPNHSHRLKIESFHLLYGSMICNLDGNDIELNKGDLLTVEKGQVHSFETEEGVIFEEVSTQHFKNDSYYLDQKIIDNKDRKTKITVKKDFLV